MRPSRGRPGGFTLVEVLIAVGIFALVGIVSAALLSRTLDARAVMAERADRLEGLQRGLQRLERDVLQYANRGIRDAYGDAQPALALTPDGALELTVQGWRNPLQVPRSELQRVQWRLSADGALERSFWAVLDRAQDSVPRVQTVLRDVRAFEVEVLDGEGGSAREWPRGDDGADAGPVRLPGDAPPGAETADAVPVALRLALVVPPFGRIERLLLVGEDLTPADDGEEAPPGGAEAEDDAGEAAPEPASAEPAGDG